MTSEAGGGIGGRLQSYAGLDGDIYLRGGGGPEATGVLNTGATRQTVWGAATPWAARASQVQALGACETSWG
jgi:hypothetical protein